MGISRMRDVGMMVAASNLEQLGVKLSAMALLIGPSSERRGRKVHMKPTSVKPVNGDSGSRHVRPRALSVLRMAAKGGFALADLIAPRFVGPRILIYHQVGSGIGHEMNVTVRAFLRQLDWMQSHGEIVSLVEAVKRRGETGPNRQFAITFDDGYADVFKNAFPILEQRNIPFTLYLTSGPIENPGAFPSWPGQPLAWDEIRAMIGSGLVTVGAHTHTHLDLRHVGEQAVVDELDRSNALITDRTGVFPAHFTYPKGWWASQAHEAVRVRYLTATLGGGKGVTLSSDLHKLHRVPVQHSDAGPLFSRKMRTGGQAEDHVRRRLRGYEGP